MSAKIAGTSKTGLASTSDMMAKPGMTARQAKAIEYGIIALCIIALLLIFQPFALPLFTIGAGLVVVGGLAFNLIPQCREGVPLSSVIKTALVVLLILGVVILLGLGTSYLYVWYLGSLRG